MSITESTADGLGSTLRSAPPLPPWAEAGLEALTQEKDEGSTNPSGKVPRDMTAGFTCSDCPNMFRPMPTCVCPLEDPPEGYEGGWDSGMRPAPFCRPRTDYNEAIGCGEPIAFTKRCRSCSRKMRRWMNARKDVRQLETVAWAREYAGRSWRLVFLTLTQPNWPAGTDPAVACRAFKKDVATWRRTVGVKSHFLGGVDYYESTVNGEDDSLNMHMHGVWVMEKLWAQSELQESWGRGIVHIKTVKGGRDAVQYVTSYLRKPPIPGVRVKERWGRCRGRAWSAIERLHQTVVIDASDADDASD